MILAPSRRARLSGSSYKGTSCGNIQGMCQIETVRSGGKVALARGGFISRIDEPCEESRAYEPVWRKRTSRRIRETAGLAVGHLLSHVKQETAVAFFNSTHQPAKLVQQTCLFPGAAPRDIVSAPALRKVGQFRRFFSVIEKLIKRDFQSARHFFQRFDGRYGMAIFHAGNIATKQSGALFDVPLRKLLIFTQCAKTVTYDHVGIVP
jgi:hypothetical protein